MLEAAAEAELWVRYRIDGDTAARDRLYQQHAPWAKAIARSVHRRVWAYPVDSDDFVQNATIGLLEAISRYNPDRGIPFRAYATPRVRGAVFNGLRAIIGERRAPAPEARFSERLEHLAAEDDNPLQGIVDSVVGLGLGFMLEAGQAVPIETRDGLVYAQLQEREARLLAAVEQLSPRLKFIVQAHYFNHVPFHELASSWGLTKGRVSQLHRAALSNLRDFLREL